MLVLAKKIMASQAEIRKRMERRADEALLDIVEGRDLGYREEAVEVAKALLRERGVQFTEVSPDALTRAKEQEDDIRARLEEALTRRSRGRQFAGLGAVLGALMFLGGVVPAGVWTPLFVLGFFVGGLYLMEVARRELNELESLVGDLSHIRNGSTDLREGIRLFIGFFLLLVIFSLIEALFF